MAIEIINSGLTTQAYYRFESGDLTTDTSAGGHTLTAISDPAEDASGKFGGAVALDGNDAYSATDHADFKPTGNFTVGAWVKVSAKASTQEVIQSGSLNTSVAGFFFRINVTTGLVQFYTGKNTGTSLGTDYQRILGGTDVTNGAWRFIVATWNGTHLNLYVDGSPDAVAVAWANAPAYAATNYVRIGCSNEAGSNADFLTGSLDDVFLLNGTALSAAQISQIYNNFVYKADLQTANVALTGVNIAANRVINIVLQTANVALTGVNIAVGRVYQLFLQTANIALTGIDIVARYTGWTKISKPTTSYTKKDKPATIWTDITKP